MGWRQINFKIVEGWLQRDTIEGEESLVRPRRCIERKKNHQSHREIEPEASRGIESIDRKNQAKIEKWYRGLGPDGKVEKWYRGLGKANKRGALRGLYRWNV
jgi:hypothetical protein